MIPLNFYRDDNYVYYNNPNGITKKMTIADFESLMSNESELPAYSSASNGKVLSVDSDGDLEWASLPPDELPAYSSSNHGEVLSVDSDGDLDWVSLPPAELPAYTSSDGGKALTVNSAGNGLEWGEVSSDAVFYVNGEITEDTPGVYTFVTDVTLEDIISAYESNKVLILVDVSGVQNAGFGWFYLKSAYVSNEFTRFSFSNSINIGDGIGSVSFSYTLVSVTGTGWSVNFIGCDVVEHTQS